MKPARHLVIDDLTKLICKPHATPLIEPGEAIAIALTAADWSPGRIHAADDAVVAMVLRAIHDAGYKIEPR